MAKNIYQKSFEPGKVTEPILGREQDMKQNHTGGFVFEIEAVDVFERFVLLGITGTMYQTSSQQFREMSPLVRKFMDEHAEESLAIIIDASENNRAISLSPVLYTFAYLCKKGKREIRQAAFSALERVVRTPTQLFEWVEYCQGFGGWSSGMRKAVNRWYANKSMHNLAYQLLKYRQRNGWTNVDVWNLSHIFSFLKKQNAKDKIALLQYVYNGYDANDTEDFPRIVEGYEKMKQVSTSDEAAQLVSEYRLVRELVPTQWLNDGKVWEALLESMPLTAIIRNLGTMTRLGVFDVFDSAGNLDRVEKLLLDKEILKKSRIHPYVLLKALLTYTSGGGYRTSWTPIPRISSVLNRALELSFDTIETTGKNFLVACDASGSMTWSENIDGVSVEPVKIATVLGLAAIKAEKNSYMITYDSSVKHPHIKKTDGFEEAVTKVLRSGGGSTNPSAVFQYALNEIHNVGVFVLITDNEVNSGEHAYELFKQYQKKYNPDAKMIVIGLTVTDFSLGDPNDASVLNIAGFNSSVPRLISEFAK